MATDTEKPVRRRFIFAPDMDKLGERVEAAEKAASQAAELYEEMEDHDDLLERLCWVVAAARDVKRGNIDVDQLMDECDKAMHELKSDLPTPAEMATRRP